MPTSDQPTVEFAAVQEPTTEEPPDAKSAAGQPAAQERRAGGRPGRNLPAAAGVGLVLGAIAIATLFTIKVIFLVYVAAFVAVALWELGRAFGSRDIRVPLPPVAVGGAAMLALAYWQGERALVAAFGVSVVGVLAWRLAGPATGYVRDVTAGIFALAYLPLLASFVALMLAAPDGARRSLVFLVVTVCSDVGGYFVGSFLAGGLLGRHLMVPLISPKKTWEGFAGSAAACLAGGAIVLPTLLHAAAWQGVLVGAAALATATLGDLAESMMKRDLGIKDMGTVLPGHGGVLDRLDSLLVTAPVVWLLLMVFLPS